ncbi:hypothetical protein H8356DRAFT_1697027 [Neocallimastix lanati (nom. inval.)]|nr:hypothetical protein H8356DRAFT_1697027 [Neocallimastix sp. JGI-2020a]
MEIRKRFKQVSYLNLELLSPELSFCFILLLRDRFSYKFNASVSKAANMDESTCPNVCPCL